MHSYLYFLKHKAKRGVLVEFRCVNVANAFILGLSTNSESQEMTNVKDKNVDSRAGTGFTNFRIRTKLLSSCSGAGVNADLAFATADPLSELIWSPHSGLSLKCAHSRADVSKPLLLWNMGTDPEVAGLPSLQQRIRLERTIADHAHACDSENCMVDREAASRHPQALQTDESRKEIAEANPAVVPLKKLESSAENDCGLGLGGAELAREKALPAEGSCMGSRICLYVDKGKGKALLDGDIYGRSSDDSAETESSHSAGPSISMKGVKRKIWDEGENILGSKRMKKQIHGSAFVMKPHSSFMKWISNMTTTKEDSLSPLPLACAIDAYNKDNFKCFRPRGPAPASMSMGYRAMFQSLYCRETEDLSTGGKKIVESVEVSREAAVQDEISPKNNVAKSDALGEDTKIGASPGRSSKPRTSLWITRLSTDTLRSDKGKEMIAEGSSDLNSQACFQVKPPRHRYSSEAMASVFARRVDALKGMQTCLLCGGCRKLEAEDVKLKLSAMRVEESCIRCCCGWEIDTDLPTPAQDITAQPSQHEQGMTQPSQPIQPRSPRDVGPLKRWRDYV